MIYTVTLNPAVDYYIDTDRFNLGELNSLNTAYTLPGGKGINVSKVLKNFGIESIGLGFVGGFTGEYIKTYLENMDIKHKFIQLEEDTRINIKLKTLTEETEIAGKSPRISKEKEAQLFSLISQIENEDIIVLSGSVPNSLNSDIYGKLIKKIGKKAKVILDTRGEAFDFGLKEGVFLVKPNHKELEEYFKCTLSSIDDIIIAGKKLQKLGSENVLISMGKEGSILITKDKTYVGNAPKGKLISSVGAGDSMVAGIVYGLSKGYSIDEAYKYGIASGSSTAFSEGLTTYDGMKELLKQIEIKEY